ncbi:MAG: HNH endonuclease [Actinomycetota bacterium]|nr:HNH endonuclease [Actinomycetota bacterium]
MSQLRSAIEELRSEVLSELPDARIEEDFSELQRAAELLEIERLRRLAEIDRRGLYERDGHLSAASWLAKTHKLAWGTAREQVRIGRALEEMPLTRRALDDGELSMSAARLLVGAREVDPDAFKRSEPELVEAARIHSIQDLGRVTSFWQQRVEQERSLDGEERLRARRRLHASVSFLGMVRVDGDLDPETGETLLTALGAVLDSEARSREKDDHRSPAQRRADALGEICRQWLDSADRASVGGERPHVTVTVDAHALAGDGCSAELDHVGPVNPETAKRVSCDGSLMRVVMSGRSEPLDVGRRTAVIPPSMRRAVIVRDRHCRFPGCDRPHTWCDTHHVVHWADGGPTALANLLLMCRRHHRMVHRPGGFRLELLDGRAVFRRADGTLLVDRWPP